MSKGFIKFLSVVYFILGIFFILATLKIIFNIIVSGQIFGEIMSTSVVKTIIIGILGGELFIWEGICLRNESKSQ